MRRRLITWTAVALGGLALAVAWVLLSPLFVDRVVDEGFPNPEATGAMATAAAAPAQEVEESMPAPMTEMEVLAAGEFYPVAHEAEGRAVIYRLEDGSRVLRFEAFEVLNGPDLHVWLVPVDPVPDTVGVEIEGYLDLGQLKGNVGSQNYTLPDSYELESGWSVVVWCVPFRVPFAAAPLSTGG